MQFLQIPFFLQRQEGHAVMPGETRGQAKRISRFSGTPGVILAILKPLYKTFPFQGDPC